MPAPTETLLPPETAAEAPGARRGRLRRVGPAALWITGVALGFLAVARYGSTPGEAAPAANEWPATSRLTRASGERSTLLVFAHPKCPCTRATMGELEILMARNVERVEAQVVFVRPPGVGADWERTELWEKAAKIPGVVVRVDEGGVEAVRFGAVTSGATFLYDARGALRFAGGITGARGQAGDNAGRSAIERLLAGGRDAPTTTPVFGCRLLAPSCTTKDAACVR